MNKPVHKNLQNVNRDKTGKFGERDVLKRRFLAQYKKHLHLRKQHSKIPYSLLETTIVQAHYLLILWMIKK